MEMLSNINNEEDVIILDCSRTIGGHGVSVWIYDNRSTNQTITYKNPYSDEKFTLHSLTIYDYKVINDIEWNIITSLSEQYGREGNFWEKFKEALNEKYKHHLINLNDITSNTKEHKAKKRKFTKEVFPKIDMVADMSQLIYNDDIVNVIFINADKKETLQFKRRKSWSHKKYIDKAIEGTGIKLSYNFHYGWEM